MAIVPSFPQPVIYYVPRLYVPPPSPPTAGPTLAEVLVGALAIGVGIAVADSAIKWLTAEPRDTYKYVYVHKGRVPHGGITNDPDRREREHRGRWPGGYLQPLGRRTTRSAARAWERANGF